MKQNPYRPPQSELNKPAHTEKRPRPPQKRSQYLFAILLATVIGSVAMRLLNHTAMDRSSLLYIGIPTVIALGMCFIPKARSVTGSIMVGITFYLLIIMIIGIEGWICILIASPLFYLVGGILGLTIDKVRNQREKASKQINMHLSFTALIILSAIEGTHKLTSFDRQEELSITRTTSLTIREVKEALRIPPQVDPEKFPLLFKLGFPAPEEFTAGGNQIGDQWILPYDLGKEEKRNLIVEIFESSEQHLKLFTVQDQTPLGNWLRWDEIHWDWHTDTTGQTKITLTLHYQRQLDPAWYFKPLQRYAVRKAGDYLIDQILHQER